jgi:hypothetical protein
MEKEIKQTVIRRKKNMNPISISSLPEYPAICPKSLMEQ